MPEQTQRTPHSNSHSETYMDTNNQSTIDLVKRLKKLVPMDHSLGIQNDLFYIQHTVLFLTFRYKHMYNVQGNKYYIENDNSLWQFCGITSKACVDYRGVYLASLPYLWIQSLYNYLNYYFWVSAKIVFKKRGGGGGVRRMFTACQRMKMFPLSDIKDGVAITRCYT